MLGTILLLMLLSDIGYAGHVVQKHELRTPEFFYFNHVFCARRRK
jgi:hypothetical protein